MRLIFMGTPDFAVPALELLALNRYDITAVYTRPDKTAGRGQIISAAPVKKAALQLGLPVFQPENLKSTAEKERLKALQPDVIVVAAYGQILPRSVLQIPDNGCVNIHPSLLPKYRGVAPVPAAIKNGDAFTGVSIMLLDKGVDTGPVLAQTQVPVMPYDTNGILMEKLSYIGARLLIDVLPHWIKKEITPRKQNNFIASYTRMLQKEDGEINWRLPALEIARQVRAYQPWPGSFTHWQGKQFKIIEAIFYTGIVSTPGKVVVTSGEAPFGIETADGILGVLKVQLEGKRVMNADEFIRGQRQLIGAILPTE